MPAHIPTKGGVFLRRQRYCFGWCVRVEALQQGTTQVGLAPTPKLLRYESNILLTLTVSYVEFCGSLRVRGVLIPRTGVRVFADILIMFHDTPHVRRHSSVAPVLAFFEQDKPTLFRKSSDYGVGVIFRNRDSIAKPRHYARVENQRAIVWFGIAGVSRPSTSNHNVIDLVIGRRKVTAGVAVGGVPRESFFSFLSHVRPHVLD